jgi:hydroxyethylthiazole kinase
MLEKIREKKPVVHCIANAMAACDCPAVVRMTGAVPLIATAIEEVAEAQQNSSALVLSIDSIASWLVEPMVVAAKKANESQHPVVLDVAGAGATEFRAEKVGDILGEANIDIIVGSNAEIEKLAGADVFTRGVDASRAEENIAKLAKKLAREKKCTVVAREGSSVVASPAGKTYAVKTKERPLEEAAGTACLSTFVIGCFAVVEADYTAAAAAALSCFGIAGELAAKKANSPAVFRQRLFDELYSLGSATVKRMQRIVELE